MRAFAAATLLAATAAVALGSPAAAAAQLGGFRPVATDGEAVQAAASFAAESMGGELASVDSAQQQTVQGTNFRMELTLQDGSRWRVTVNRSLQDEFSMLGEPAQLQAATSEDGPDTGDNQGQSDDQ
jgi:hypothetical protein